jgi:multiple sugar transport system permease protein
VVLLLSAMAGYAFAKKRFTGRNVIFWITLALLMVPFQVTLVPLFILVSDLGWVNSYWGLIVPGLATTQGVFLMRQFISQLPDELFEAARLDGASELRMFVQIVLPLVRPALATLGVFVFLWNWNDFLWPLVIAQEDSMRTLTVGLATLQAEQSPIGVVMASAVVSLVPSLIVFFVLQRFYVQGIASSGLK